MMSRPVVFGAFRDHAQFDQIGGRQPRAVEPPFDLRPDGERAGRPTAHGRTRDREDQSSIPDWWRLAWMVVGASCIAYLTVSLAHHQAFHPFGRRDYFDLRVYRGAAHLIVNGRPLYDAPILRWAPFTYPPFAAIAFAPLALLPLTLDELLVTGLGVVCLFATLSRALRLPSGGGPWRADSKRWRSAAVALAAAAALWLEPTTATLGYGQVNLLIAFLIVFDLSRRETAKTKGALIGLAAGLKLTPLIFVPYLLFSGRRRAALVALLTTASTVALGYVLLPGDTRWFWSGLFLDPRRAGGCCVPANQSLRGTLLTLAPSAGRAAPLVIALLVAVAGVALAVRAGRRGDEAMGFSLCAITGLLASPVSWTHHWTLAIPALLLLGVRVFSSRSRAGMIVVAGILLVGYSYLPTLMATSRVPSPAVLRTLWTLASAPYVVIGLGALAVAFVHEIRAHRRTHPRGCLVGPAARLPFRELASGGKAIATRQGLRAAAERDRQRPLSA
jgi:alpha-1,2-mannosyltransferase